MGFDDLYTYQCCGMTMEQLERGELPSIPAEQLQKIVEDEYVKDTRLCDRCGGKRRLVYTDDGYMRAPCLCTRCKKTSERED